MSALTLRQNVGRAITWDEMDNNFLFLQELASNRDFSQDAVIIQRISFAAELLATGTSGAVLVDWSQGRNYRMGEPTGPVTLSFIDPEGPCHLQLYIPSDGASAAEAFTLPGNVKQFGATWTGTALNKAAILSLWFDGTDYRLMGVNEV